MKEPGRFIQVIMGPRQVGKTTIVTQVLASLKISYTFESAHAVPASNSLGRIVRRDWENMRLTLFENDLQARNLI
jgi:predicted AAA+ superfamily ATPase